MEQFEIKRILESVRDGGLSPEDAMLRLKEAPYTDLGYARIDNHRQIRQGFAEVIYGEGKTQEQILGIVRKMYEGEVKTILVTRLSEEKALYLENALAAAAIAMFAGETVWPNSVMCPDQRMKTKMPIATAAAINSTGELTANAARRPAPINRYIRGMHHFPRLFKTARKMTPAIIPPTV